MENTTEIKNSMDGLNSKLDTNEKRLRSPEQNTHNFRFKKKTEKMKEKSLREMKDGMKKKKSTHVQLKYTKLERIKILKSQRDNTL